MNIIKSIILCLLFAIIIYSCKDDDFGPQLVAVTGPDTTATIGDTVRLDASASTGKGYDILWKIKTQPGNDTITNSDSVHAWFIPFSNGLYQVQLTLSKGGLFSDDYQNVTVSGSVVLSDTVASHTRLRKIAQEDDPDYLVKGNLTVLDELIIDPNVIIEFENDGAIIVKDEGLIYADNTSFIPADSTWKGIHLMTSDNIFSNCLIDGAGNSSFTGLASGKAALLASGNSTLAFSGNTISNSEGYGISIIDNADFYFNQANQIYPFNGNRFESNESGPAVLPVGTVSELVAQIFTNETPGTYIEIYGSTYSSQEDQDPLLSDIGLAYKITGLITFNKNLTITKGVELYFDTDAGIRINGMLTVSGSVDEPVIMDGLNGGNASWTGIWVNDGQSNITYASILNAGNTAFPGMTEKASLIADQTLSMQNCTITGSGGIGLYMPDYAHILYTDNFISNTLSNNAVSAVRIRMDDVVKVTAGNSISAASSLVPAIEVHMGLDDPLGTWPDLGANIDYKILESLKIKSTKDLSLQAGVKMQFAAGTTLEVSGGLQALGSSGSEIIFEGSESKNGHWDGIFMNGTEAVTLDYTIIRDGGGGLIDKANLIVESTASNLAVTNSVINNSKGYGVLIKAGAQDFEINDPASSNTLDGDLGGFHNEN
jgi:hypothetical protein